METEAGQFYCGSVGVGRPLQRQGEPRDVTSDSGAHVPYSSHGLKTCSVSRQRLKADAGRCGRRQDRHLGMGPLAGRMGTSRHRARRVQVPEAEGTSRVAAFHCISPRPGHLNPSIIESRKHRKRHSL